MCNGEALDLKFYRFWMLLADSYINSRLSDTRRFHRAYTVPDFRISYYVQEYMYSLRFNTQIAIADFPRLEDALERALMASWIGNITLSYPLFLFPLQPEVEGDIAFSVQILLVSALVLVFASAQQFLVCKMSIEPLGRFSSNLRADYIFVITISLSNFNRKQLTYTLYPESMDECRSNLHRHITWAGLGGSVGCRLETRKSRDQPPPRPATFFCGD